MSNSNLTRPLPASCLPALIAAAGDAASLRFLEFFAANIRNAHTRRAYGRAVADFLAWCGEHGVPSIAAVQPLHVATWIEMQTRELSAPTVKQHLAAIRHLFDWLVTGQVVPVVDQPDLCNRFLRRRRGAISMAPMVCVSLDLRTAQLWWEAALRTELS